MNSASVFPAQETVAMSVPVTAPAPAAGMAGKSAAQITDELLGFPPDCVAAALRFWEGSDFADFCAMLPGMIAFHLPRSAAARMPAELNDGLRLKEDLGLDSLALTEMAFKLDDLFGIAIEMRDVAGLGTVGELKVFLQRRLGPT